jgi:hypothetical protein
MLEADEHAVLGQIEKQHRSCALPKALFDAHA